MDLTLVNVQNALRLSVINYYPHTLLLDVQPPLAELVQHMVTCLKIPDRAPPPPIFIYYTLWIPEYQNPILENSLMNFSPRPFIYKHSPFHSLSTQQEQTSQTLASALVCFLAEITNDKFTSSHLPSISSLLSGKIIFMKS